MAYSDDGDDPVLAYGETKDRANRRKHGIGLARAAELFASRHVEQIDETMDYGEERWTATGVIGGKFMTCTYAPRGNHRRIISLRRATRREIEKFFQAD